MTSNGMVSVPNTYQRFRKRLALEADQLLICFDRVQVDSAASGFFRGRAQKTRLRLDPLSIRDVPLLCGMVNAICQDIDLGVCSLTKLDVSKRTADLMLDLMRSLCP